MCVRMTNYAVLVNGDPMGCIFSSRGIRQGEYSISPYLFLICAEAFRSLLTWAEMMGRLAGVLMSKRAPRINHLFFVDDSLLFCKVNV
jgi:hypothetical protein